MKIIKILWHLEDLHIYYDISWGAIFLGLGHIWRSKKQMWAPQNTNFIVEKLTVLRDPPKTTRQNSYTLPRTNKIKMKKQGHTPNNNNSNK